MIAYRTLFVALAGFAAATHAQTFNFTVTPAGVTPSTMSANFSGSANFTGTFLGNYDQATNAGGTRTLNWNILGTRPAAPTNLTKNLHGSGTSSGTANGNPVGTYALAVSGGNVTLTSLSTNLVGAATPATSPVSATVTYDSFLTATPNYSYPFLIPLTIQLGTASLTSLQVTQTGAASGALTSAGGGRYTFSLSVPADVTATLNFQGSPSTQTQSETLTVTGNVTPGTGSAVASLTISLNQNDNNTTPQPQAPAPFDMPDPSGSANPAHLILTLTITSEQDSIQGSATLPANGVLAPPPPPPCGSADFNGDGDVATDADIEAFFACVAGNCCATCGSADFNGDGDSATDADIEAFFRVIAGGHC